jgi:hypothetical protein
VFLSSSFIYQQAKRLSLFIILGFRAGTLRHLSGEFPPRQIGCTFLLLEMDGMHSH